MFVSYAFIAFIIGVFLVYYLVPRKIQWIVLLIANFIFYFSANKWYPIYICVTALTVYLAGIFINKENDKYKLYLDKVKAKEIPKPSREEKKKVKAGFNNKKKAIMLVCLIFNIGILAVTKYTDFVIDNVNTILVNSGKNELDYANLLVPLGISFYTFQAVGYLLDVYWEKCQVQKNFFKFLLFVSFFPQLIQGPISRYDDLSKSLYEEHKPVFKTIKFGIVRIIWGYFKKLVVADRISAAVAMIMSDTEYYTGVYIIIGMFFYAAQLYADFTGGIDITIGIAETMGIELKENFERPFFSKNIIEYWRRWHITMGTWFRDYIFYPCSISKPMKNITTFTKKHFGMAWAKRIAIYIATFLTWFATGIWHGAEWHFIVWGIANGIIIMITGELEPLYDKFHKKFPKLYASTFWKIFMITRTFLLMCLLRMFDTYASVKLTFVQYVHMFTQFNKTPLNMQELLDLGLKKADYVLVLFGVIVMFIVSMLGRNGSVREKIEKKPQPVRYLIYMALLFAVILLGTYGVGFDSQQFIYNQF